MKQVDVKQLYNQVPQTVWVGVRVAVQFQSQLPAEWEPAPDRGLGSSGPRLSSPAEWGRSAAKVRGTWGQYVAVCSVSNSPLTHNQYQPFRNPFKNKVWEVYFSKEACSFVIIVDYVSVYSCICIMWLYKIIKSFTSPTLVALPRLREQSILLFSHSWREYSCMHSFPKSISAMRKENSLFQGLNSDHRQR